MNLDNNKPIILVDHHGTIIYINTLFESNYGWNKSDLINQSIHLIIPENLHDAHNVGFSRFLNTEEATLMNQPLPLQILKKNGNTIEATHLIKATKEQGLWFFGANIHY